MKKEKGITLIALVITIIVLLILAGVALATLTGDSGILINSEKAKEDTLEANAKEKVQLAIMEHKIGQFVEGKTLKEYLEAAGAKDVTEAGTKGTMDGYNFEIKDGIVKITKGETEELTLKDVYTPEIIGQTINYIANNDAIPEDINWVIIGQDEKENLLATTSRPLGEAAGEESFKFAMQKRSAASWLTFEEDLKTHCKGIFSGTVQGKTVEARSMTVEDVNNLTGFIEPKFNTYTFTNQETNDFANKIVNYYHPDEATENKWGKSEKVYECDNYYYYENASDNNNIYCYYQDETQADSSKLYTGEALKNLELVLGPTSSPYTSYVLASRSVSVYSNVAYFSIGGVYNSRVSTSGKYFGGGNSSTFVDEGNPFSAAVRPVVTLSSDFKVIEEDGTWKLAE